MPRSKVPESYPLQFVKVAERCAVRGESVVLSFPTWREALRVQQTFIAYTAAMRKIRDNVGTRTPTAYEAHWIQQLDFAARTQVWVQRHSNGAATLTFQNRENSELGRMLDNAKVMPGPKRDDEAEQFFREIAKGVQFEGAGGPGAGTGEVPFNTEADIQRVYAAAQRGNRKAIAEMQKLGIFGEDGREIPDAWHERRKSNG